VEQMQKEEGWWKETGRRFEEFKPSSQSKVPPEWWIAAYSIRRLFTKEFWGRKEDAKAGRRGSETVSGNGGPGSIV